MSFGSVAPIDPPTCRNLISRIIVTFLECVAQ